MEIQRSQIASDAPGGQDHGGGFEVPDCHSCSILVIDDEGLIRTLIGHVLTSAGFTDVDFAADGQAGLDKAMETHPDLIILDLNMPGLDGVTVLTRLRADGRFDETPIIVETANNSTEARNDVLRLGATNIVSKPLDAGILLDRVRLHLEKNLMMESLKKYHDRVEQELESARGMQMQLLPPAAEIEEVEHAYGVRLDWHFQPSSELGGDWWGVHAIDDDRFAIFVVDFSGHGVGAAINTFRLHTVMAEVKPLAARPSQYLEVLNDLLVDLIPRGQFATMLHATIDVATHTITYASAGHTAPVIGNFAAGTLAMRDRSGLPLGIKANTEYTDHELPFGADDCLFLYSDALIESPGTDGTELDDPMLMGWINDYAALPDEGTGCLQWLMDRFYGYAATPIPDDVTAIWVQRNADP